MDKFHAIDFMCVCVCVCDCTANLLFNSILIEYIWKKRRRKTICWHIMFWPNFIDTTSTGKWSSKPCFARIMKSDMVLLSIVVFHPNHTEHMPERNKILQNWSISRHQNENIVILKCSAFKVIDIKQNNTRQIHAHKKSKDWTKKCICRLFSI